MECGICYRAISEHAFETFGCGHSTCRSCFHKLRQFTCPFCRAPIQEPEWQLKALDDGWIKYYSTDNVALYFEDDDDLEEYIMYKFASKVHRRKRTKSKNKDQFCHRQNGYNLQHRNNNNHLSQLKLNRSRRSKSR